MSISVTIVILLLVSTSSLVNSFNLSFLDSISSSPHTFHIRPGLDELAEKQKYVQLQLNLDIGMNDENTFTIRDMVLELQKSLPRGKEEEAMLPGANGWCKSISSQRRSMELIKSGNFINMKGQQNINMFRPSWELIWPEETPSGSLVMGFELPEDYSRNEHSTTFTSGNICIRFQVWSKSTLAYGQAERHRLVSEHDRLCREKEESLDLFNECQIFNPIQKVLHLRHAVIADDELERVLSALEAAGPDLSSSKEGEEYNENIVMKLKDDLYITKVGHIYHQSGNFDGGHQQEKVGTARLVKFLSSMEEKSHFGVVSPTTSISRRQQLRP